MSQLLLATNNPGKQRELQAILAQLQLDLVTPAQAMLALEVHESGESYLDNARLKAHSFARAYAGWALADDTGLEVEALDGRPGLYSARLAGEQGDDASRRALLLELLAEHPRPWVARFRCTMVLAGPDGSEAWSEGICPGVIVPEARGQGGFGYDPVFEVAGTGQTMAELGPERKNTLSHRARAAEKLLPEIRRRLNLPGPSPS